MGFSDSGVLSILFGVWNYNALCCLPLKREIDAVSKQDEDKGLPGC
jgi:hypothetical protein